MCHLAGAAEARFSRRVIVRPCGRALALRSTGHSVFDPEGSVCAAFDLRVESDFEVDYGARHVRTSDRKPSVGGRSASAFTRSHDFTLLRNRSFQGGAGEVTHIDSRGTRPLTDSPWEHQSRRWPAEVASRKARTNADPSLADLGYS